MKILIQAGADKNQTDGIGRNPQVIADDHFKKQVSTYLKSLKWMIDFILQLIF